MNNGTSQAADLSHWLTKREAADRLGCSERTIDRLIRKGEIQSTLRQRPRSRPETVLNPEDVEYNMPQPHVMPPQPSQAIATRDELGLLTRVAQILHSPPPQPAPPRYPLWLSLTQACEYSGLGPGHIDRLIAQKILIVMRRPLRICKASLDAHANGDVPWIEP
jgi:hypothetical protein